MSYRYQQMLAVVIATMLAMIGAAQLVGVVNLGLPPGASAWLGIVTAGLGILQGFLPRMNAPRNNNHLPPHG